MLFFLSSIFTTANILIHLKDDLERHTRYELTIEIKYILLKTMNNKLKWKCQMNTFEKDINIINTNYNKSEDPLLKIASDTVSVSPKDGYNYFSVTANISIAKTVLNFEEIYVLIINPDIYNRPYFITYIETGKLIKDKFGAYIAYELSSDDKDEYINNNKQLLFTKYGGLNNFIMKTQDANSRTKYQDKTPKSVSIGTNTEINNEIPKSVSIGTNTDNEIPKEVSIGTNTDNEIPKEVSTRTNTNKNNIDKGNTASTNNTSDNNYLFTYILLGACVVALVSACAAIYLKFG